MKTLKSFMLLVGILLGSSFYIHVWMTTLTANFGEIVSGYWVTVKTIE